jgi:hypothetical protein
LKVVNHARTVEIITRRKIFVNALLKLLSILKQNAYHAFYQNISTFKLKNVETVQLIKFMILAHINVYYVHLKDHFLVIKNVYHALQINFTTKLPSLVKNAALEGNMML